MAIWLAFLLLVSLLAVGLVVLVVVVTTARPAHSLTAEVASARRHGLLTSVVSTLAFVVFTIVLLLAATRSGPGGAVRETSSWVGAVPLLAALLALGVLAAGELTWPRPRGLTREVNLNPRTPRDLVLPGWRLALVGLGGAAVVVIIVGGLAADASGGSVAAARATADGVVRSSAGPFPGWRYGAPQLAGLLAALAALAGVLRLAVLRPAVVHSDVETDNRLRAASASRAIRVVVSALALTTGANLFFGGSAGLRVFVAGWQDAVAAGALAFGVLLAVVGAGLVLAPAPRLPREAPVPAGRSGVPA